MDPTFISIMEARAGLNFSTKELTAINSCGISGCELTNFDAYLQKLVKYGTRAGAGSHVQIRVATGLMVPRTMSASHGAVAELGFEVFPVSADGAAAAVAITEAQNLPAGGSVGEAFTIGPVSINGTEVDVEAISVEFGINVRLEGSSGQPWNTFVCVMDRRPIIRVTTPDLDAVKDIDITGVAQGATNSLVYFRQLKHTALRWADNESKHIKIAIDDGMITQEGPSASHGDRGMTDLIITPAYDGTNAIMVVTVNTAIV